MPEIKNTFLKGRMNQDLDSRILPQGEYREAINLLISRSEGSTVGEFENVLGNTESGLVALEGKSVVIGHFVDETNNRVFVFVTDWINADGDLAASDTTHSILQFDLSSQVVPAPTILVSGFFLNFNKSFPIYGVNLVDDLLFWTDNLNQPRRINIVTAATSPTAYTYESQISVAQYYPYNPIIPLERITATAAAGGTSTQIITSTSQPNIRVGDVVTDNNKTNVPLGGVIRNNIPVVKVTEIVSTVAPFNTFNVSPAIIVDTIGTTGALASGDIIDFSRTTMENQSEEYLSNYSIQTIDALHGGGTNIMITDPSFGGIPRVGDIIKLVTNIGGTTLPYYELNVGSLAIDNTASPSEWRITFEKSMTGEVSPGGAAATGFQVGDIISIGTNPLYTSTFKGDEKFLDDKFIRFSYRFRFEDNEYSLMAPFTQIMFIPKQFGQFGLGQLTPATSEAPNYYQDETDAYTSTILQWFENDTDSIALKIPMPSSLAKLSSTYHIKEIDILYRESDALAVKVLDTLEVSSLVAGDIKTIEYDDDVHGIIDQEFIEYNYKSNKPYKTLTEAQTVRVYDKVPIKALGQEIISNRVVYGNYVERMTPPLSIPYRATFAPRDATSTDYSTQYPYSTIKQNRTYQVGFVLADYYGRQSDVILSSYDNTTANEGSSIYVPYRNSGDATDAQVIDWIGQGLNLTIENSFGKSTALAGEPGIYKENNHVTQAGWTISNVGGVTYYADKNYTTTVGSGSGTGCTVRVTVTTASPGKITNLVILTSGTGYSKDDVLTIDGGTATITLTEVGAANPLGWYTYKVVVKQQEQEYYNVFLPGFVNGLPINNKVWDGMPYYTTSPYSDPGFTAIETERNKIFFCTVLSDNINKIPRRLDNVGPTDEEFNSDEILYIRVNNPNATDTLAVRNLQYYPNTLSQNVLNIATVKETELAAVPFVGFSIGPNPGILSSIIASVGGERVYGNSHPSGYQGDYGSTLQFVPLPIAQGTSPETYAGAVNRVPTGSIPWGDVSEKQSFYAADQNPFIMKVGQVSNYNNPVGAIVCGNQQPAQGGYVQHDTNYPDGIRAMEPILSVAETKPVYSLLDIFWESTLTGKLEELNGAIDTNYNGIVAITDNSGSFAEDLSINGDTGHAFYFINGSGAQINTNLTTPPTINKIVRQSATGTSLVPVGDYFDIAAVGSNGQYYIKTKKYFWFNEDSALNSTDVYILDISTTYNGETNILSNAIILNLTNEDPSIWSNVARDATNFTVAIDSIDTQVIQLYGKNGSADTTVVDGEQNRWRQLVWSIEAVIINTGTDTSTFSIDSTGNITVSNMVTNVQYALTVRVTDANGVEGSGTLYKEESIIVNTGTPYAPLALETGLTNSAFKLAGAANSGEWIFGDVTNAYYAGSNSLSSSPSLIYNAQKEYQASTNPANSCKAWLWQGELEISLTFESIATAIFTGDAVVSYIVQHRTFTPPNSNNTNSRGAWEQIDSVDWIYDEQTATQDPFQVSIPVNNSANSTTKILKFDQLGEYRVITGPLTGEFPAYVTLSVNFKDGNCRVSGGTYCNLLGPCTP